MKIFAACPSCNRYKAARQTAINPTTGQEVPLFHPHLQAWTEHFRWNEDATEIIGLTPTGRATITALKMNRPQISRVRRCGEKWVNIPQKLSNGVIQNLGN